MLGNFRYVNNSWDDDKNFMNLWYQHLIFDTKVTIWELACGKYSLLHFTAPAIAKGTYS